MEIQVGLSKHDSGLRKLMLLLLMSYCLKMFDSFEVISIPISYSRHSDTVPGQASEAVVIFGH